MVFRIGNFRKVWGWRFGAVLALLAALLAPAMPSSAAAELCFPAETGKCISGIFLDYWQANGGLAQQGYPITDVFDEINPSDGKTYPTQYFERARFEYHAENAGTPYEVLLGLLGGEQYKTRYPEGRPPTNLEGRPDYCFVETQRCVAEPFLTYWREHGGLAQQGYPLSDQFEEVSPTNGNSYQVQYFERARFEYHPENAGTQYEVLLGLLGREQYFAKEPAELDFPTVYTDDFSDTTRWPTPMTNETSAKYENGRYVLRAAGNTMVNNKLSVEVHTALPGVPQGGGGTRALDEVRIAVDATPKTAGGSGYGLSCRTQGDTIRYTATVSMLFPQQGPKYGAKIAVYPAQGQPGQTLVEVNLASGVIALNETARLEFTCAGPNLTLRVNGAIVAQVQDYTLTNGGFGFEASDVVSGAGAGAANPLVVEFDNLTVDSWK